MWRLNIGKGTDSIVSITILSDLSKMKETGKKRRRIALHSEYSYWPRLAMYVDIKMGAFIR